MSASFASALNAAQEAAASQHYPAGTLYIVATPIGNLCDISLRALHVLGLVDAIACEDTRHTQALLRAYGIDKPSAQLLAVHQHNETEAAHNVVRRLQQGERIAYVSDAGTPAISDPGARVVVAARAVGIPVVPLPGASSITAALSAAGIVQDTGFVFIGFLPSKATERDNAALALLAEPRAVVLLEAPHRIEALARSLACLGPRPVTVAREITKQFEEIATVPAQDVTAWLAAQSSRTRGEFVLVVHPAPPSEAPVQDLRVLKLLLAELPLKTAVQLCADITGEPRKVLYTAALALKSEADEDS